MASVAASVRTSIRGLAPEARQLGWAWLIGSLTLGTITLIELRTRPVLGYPLPAAGRAIVPFPSAGTPLPPFALMPGWAQLTIIALFAVLFIALVSLGWRTRTLSWLPHGIRGRLLWGLVVVVVGLAAWWFAATVTFAARFSPDLQIALGYAGGGLPFALIAAMLLRSLKFNVWAAGVSAVLLAIGFILVAARSPDQPSVIRFYFQYLLNVLGGGQVILY